MLVLREIIMYLRKNSYQSQLFYFIGKKIQNQSTWVSGFQSSERALGVVEIANFENTGYIMSKFFTFFFFLK